MCQPQVVTVVADLSMGTPSPFGGRPFMMSRKVALPANKAKRGLFFDPGNPLRRIWLNRAHPSFGADDDVAPFLAILDQGDDLCRLTRRLGRGSGSRTSVFG